MPVNHSINYVELPGKDLGALEAFYSAAFGWIFTDYGPEYRAFSDGSFDGGFRRSGKKSKIDRGAALVVLYSDNLEGTRERVTAAGGSIHQDIFSFPGGRRFHFLDPHGNELAVWSDR